jgi:nitroreductase
MTTVNPAEMSVSAAVASRTSIRAFLDRPVDGELVRRLLAAAARSPSGGNLQPWQVHVLAGAELARFKALIAGKQAVDPRGDGPGYDIYPADLAEPYKSRRGESGEAMYATMGIAREDKAARLAFIAGNFRFWDAPVGMFFCIDKRMGPPQWSDLGMYIQTLMLLAREAGLDSCPQEAWTMWHRTVAEFLGLPNELMLFCGLALGYRDPAHPVNGLRTRRAPLEEFAVFHGL